MASKIPNLDEVTARHRELEAKMADPTIASDPKAYSDLAREHSHLSELVSAYAEWKVLERRQAEARELASDPDPEMSSMAEEELEAVADEMEELEPRILKLLRPPDPNDGKNLILEIRAGTGGDEAALFAADLLRMYRRFGESRRWKFELMDSSPTDGGGFREVILQVRGNDAWSALKYEGGTHRVQRVPTTETQGRIHTSAATVAVMPEADEVELDIDPSEVRVDVFRASGPGGQSVNTTDSAVRLTHEPTGITVSCQDEKSQHKNKAKAMRILRTRLLDLERQKAADEMADLRRGQVGSGDRSEKIRTYNFPQNRVTDHRAGITQHNLDKLMEGEIDGLLQAVSDHFEALALAQSAEV